MSNLFFRNSYAYRVPDTAHYVCQNCIDKKEGKVRHKASFIKSMCDVCEKKRDRVYNVNDVDWREYSTDNIGNIKWNTP